MFLASVEPVGVAFSRVIRIWFTWCGKPVCHPHDGPPPMQLAGQHLIWNAPPGLENLTWDTWVCTSYWAGADPSSPIAATWSDIGYLPWEYLYLPPWQHLLWCYCTAGWVGNVRLGWKLGSDFLSIILTSSSVSSIPLYSCWVWMKDAELSFTYGLTLAFLAHKEVQMCFATLLGKHKGRALAFLLCGFCPECISSKYLKKKPLKLPSTVLRYCIIHKRSELCKRCSLKYMADLNLSVV